MPDYNYSAARDKYPLPDRQWSQIKSKYGLCKEAYGEALLLQGYTCPICDEPLGDDQVVDHCHKTGVVRGIVHNQCNKVLGYLEARPRVLELVPHYLHSRQSKIHKLVNIKHLAKIAKKYKNTSK
jgi:hypothetical protein